MSERVMFEVKPPRVGEAREFRTFQDIMADAVLAAHVEVGTEPKAAAKYILARLDALGLALGPKQLVVQEDGSLRPAWLDMAPGPVELVEPGRAIEAFAPLPDFRSFYAAKNGPAWPCPFGTPLEMLHRQLADASADYFDEIRKRLLP